VVRELGAWSGPAEATPFSQFAPATADTEGDQLRSRQMRDLFNCEQIDEEEASTSEMLVPIVDTTTDLMLHDVPMDDKPSSVYLHLFGTAYCICQE
jgi:hypothetical protein